MIPRGRFFSFLTSTAPLFRVALMCFTFNIDIGISAGFIFYPRANVLPERSYRCGPGFMYLRFFVSYFLFSILAGDGI
jgi:xanthine/uracil/vitamin C permease (AzgA family)